MILYNFLNKNFENVIREYRFIDSLIELLLLETDNYKKQVEIIRDLIKNTKKVHIYEI